MIKEATNQYEKVYEKRNQNRLQGHDPNYIKNEECSISQFISEHNHDLQGSCSKIPKANSLIQPIRKIETAKGVEARACAKFCDMSYSKHLRAKKINIIQPKDAQGLIDYLKKLR